MVRVKKNATICKILRHILTRNVPHFYGLPLDLCGKCGIRYFIAALFAKRTAIRHFHGKSVAILGLRHFT